MLWASQPGKVTQISRKKMVVSRCCKAAHVSVILGGGVGFRTSRRGGGRRLSGGGGGGVPDTKSSANIKP